MAAQPDFLYAFDDGSGTTITNYGSTSSGDLTYVDGSGAENTDWQHVSGADALGDYLDAYVGIADWQGASTSATAPSTTVVDRMFALRFRLVEFEGGSNQVMLATEGNVPFQRTTDPTTGTADFNLILEESHSSQGVSITYEDLDFDTDYTVVWFLDTSTSSAVRMRASLDGATVVTSSTTADWSAAAYLAEHPVLMSGATGTGTGFGRKRFYGLAFDRGNAYSDADIESAATSLANFTGWPGGGGGLSVPVAQKHYRQLRG